MKYDFDKIIDRSGTNSVKYDLRRAYFKHKDVIPLWVADMDFETPDFIIDAMQNRLQHPIMGYSIRSREYTRSICTWLQERHNWTVRANEISFSPGVVPGLVMATLAFSNPGDSILVQSPVYFPFYITVQENNRKLVYNPLKETPQGYIIDFDDLEEKLKQGVKMLMFSNPHNPVGRAWLEGELENLLDLCEQYDVLILSDEIHADLVFKPNKHTPLASLSKRAAMRTITYMAASKTFNVAGLSTAFVVIQNKELMQKYNQILEAMHLFAGNIMGAVATKAAFDQGNLWREQMLDYVSGNIDFVDEFLKARLPKISFIRPEATYLLWLDFRALGWEQKKLVDFLINKAGVGLNDGSIFSPGGEGFMRMNVACPRAILEKALVQISEAFN
ncbi:MAG: cystathionine beta-lyase [Bacteroidetes bacterium]|nr:MAG: cystathionine beta-lyase [Bacteroidota bacterium]